MHTNAGWHEIHMHSSHTLRKTEWGEARGRDTIGHLMCKWPTVRAPRNGLAFYFIWFCDFWFWLCLLLLATYVYVCMCCMYVCVYFVYCQLSVSVSIEREKAKRTAHAGCWWSNAQCCCLIKSRMREYYFALPQSWRRCFCCCCCLRCGAACCATVDVVSCLCVSATHAHSSSQSSYVLPFLSLPASYTALSAHQHTHTHLQARIHCIYFLPSSHSRGSFVIKLAGTTSQLTATKSWHSGAHKFMFHSRN